MERRHGAHSHELVRACGDAAVGKGARGEGDVSMARIHGRDKSGAGVKRGETAHDRDRT